MAGSTTNISIRMDSNLKAQADAFFGELGMNLSTAFNILFVSHSVKVESRLTFLWIAQTKKRLPPCWRQKGLQKIHP